MNVTVSCNVLSRSLAFLADSDFQIKSRRMDCSLNLSYINYGELRCNSVIISLKTMNFKLQLVFLLKNNVSRWTFLHVSVHMITFGDFQFDWRKSCVGLQPTPKIPAAREKNLWYPGYLGNYSKPNHSQILIKHQNYLILIGQKILPGQSEADNSTNDSGTCSVIAHIWYIKILICFRGFGTKLQIFHDSIVFQFPKES